MIEYEQSPRRAGKTRCAEAWEALFKIDEVMNRRSAQVQRDPYRSGFSVEELQIYYILREVLGG